jgi:hypothetical protein
VSEYYEPKFIGGPKDGGIVPAPLWVLDNIEMIQRLPNSVNVIYYYKLDEKTKDYIYEGQVEE